jgi:hypothetical protein
VDRNADIADLQKLAYELFFARLSPEDLSHNDIRDSMINNCFGLALDFKLRCNDWGFSLSDVKANVWMRHSRFDNLIPAEITSRLLPHCILDIQESDVHFSKETLDDFIQQTMAPFYEK